MRSAEVLGEEERPISTIYVAALLEHRRSGRLILVKDRDGRWALPSGQKKTEEDLIAALLREVEEEVSIAKREDITDRQGMPGMIPLQVVRGNRFLLGLVFPASLRIDLGRDKLTRGWLVEDPGGDIIWAKPFDALMLTRLVDQAEQLLAYPHFNTPALMYYLTHVCNEATDSFFQTPLSRKMRSLCDWLLDKSDTNFPGLEVSPLKGIGGIPFFRYNIQGLMVLPIWSKWGV